MKPFVEDFDTHNVHLRLQGNEYEFEVPTHEENVFQKVTC